MAFDLIKLRGEVRELSDKIHFNIRESLADQKIMVDGLTAQVVIETRGRQEAVELRAAAKIRFAEAMVQLDSLVSALDDLSAVIVAAACDAEKS